MGWVAVLSPPQGPGVEEVVVPRYKKVPELGDKVQLRSSRVWLDQADAAELAEGAEVTLMDWGNIIVQVS